MIIAFISIVIAICFFIVAGRIWEGKDKNSSFILSASGILVMLFGFLIFFIEVSDDIRTETKTITLQLLEKDNKVNMEISKDYNNLIYKLTDSTLTNTFKYLTK